MIQDEFLEDHGFLIESDKILTVIDHHASYTLEYATSALTTALLSSTCSESLLLY